MTHFHSVHSALTVATSSFNGSSKSLGLLTALRSTFKEIHSFHEVGHFPNENATIFPPWKLISSAKGCTSSLDNKQMRTTPSLSSHSIIQFFASVRKDPERELEPSSSRIFTPSCLISKLPGGLQAFNASQKWSTASIGGLDSASCKISKRRFLELFFPLETIFGCVAFSFPFFRRIVAHDLFKETLCEIVRIRDWSLSKLCKADNRRLCVKRIYF